MKNYRDIIYLRGKESIFVNILFLIVLIIFIVPIALIFGLRLIYKLVRGVQEKVSTSTSEVASGLEKVY
jgi:hypothetical protein